MDVKAAAINRGELRLLSMRDPGWRPGQDLAGVVSKAAADGSGPGEGARVVAWVDQAGWSQRAVADVDRVAVIAEATSFTSAATLPVAGITALRALREGGSLLGKSVLITGAAGGVGRFAVELAAKSGARVTAIADGQERSEGLVGLGASEVVSEIGAAAGEFDLVLESVGGESLEHALALAAHSGIVVVFGSSSGEPARFSFRDFSQRPVRIVVFFVYQSGYPFGPDLQRLANMAGDGSLTPHVGLEVSWTEANSALQRLSDRAVNGKAVLVVD